MQSVGFRPRTGGPDPLPSIGGTKTRPFAGASLLPGPTDQERLLSGTLPGPGSRPSRRLKAMPDGRIVALPQLDRR